MTTDSLLAAVTSFVAGSIDAKPTPIFTNVYVGTQGPFRFLVNTGAETSVIDPALATKLGLKPQYRVEQVTLNGSRLVPALKIATLHIGGAGEHTIPETELIIHDVDAARRLHPAVAGILGFAALSGFDFTLKPSSGELDYRAERPATGAVVPFFRIEGRLAVKARMGAETPILDFGSTSAVLFRTPEAMKKTHPVPAAITTIEGARAATPTLWTADMHFGDRLRVGTLPAAIVQRQSSEVHGLLPISVFKEDLRGSRPQ